MNITARIHPTAIVDPDAQLADDVSIGPYAIIEGATSIGPRCEVKAHAQILRGTSLGADCQVFQGAVLGGPPQDITFQGDPTPVVIGEGTVLREYVTVHHGTKPEGTVIGSQAYLMAYVHVGHDGRVGDHVILADLVQLGGFAQIHDYAFIGGATPVHQFCRVGTQAFVAGAYRVVQDIPPYVLATGEPLRFGGLNVVGLRRRGFSADTRALIKKAYRLIYRSEHNLSRALEIIKEELEPTPEIQTILSFIEQGTRGII
ncbi:MAG: acyl-ACP--UDP-N-acetylglucosamine O-acyltransferase [Fidelibacterota bacterium]|nr:MAG: acyl-ACP--UDP-N-acetylglucosamine O-acyltransferase [Candidatus Neomarinimicrobiota bacterium]